MNTKKKKLCTKKAVKKDWIEDLVINYTMKAIMNDEVMERLIDTLMELQKKESTNLPLLKKFPLSRLFFLLYIVAFFIYRFRKFDTTKREQRQRLIDSFVNAVYLYEDKVVMTFNYKDGSKTVTLAEVEGLDLSCFGAF